VTQSSDAGAEAGAGSDAGSVAPGIAVRTSAFGGEHLTNSDGRPLYFFGTDIPGDCNNDPTPRCSDTCLQSWPVFNDPLTNVDPAVEENALGSTLDSAGRRIVTYYGWPLYYYATDTKNPSNMRWTTNGAGVGKVWHLAKVRPPNIVVMRADSTSSVFYLANGSGMTLYAYASDTTGAQPVSACVGACLNSFQPLLTNSISAVSTLDTSDLSLFVRSDSGKLQAAYKGAPLYVALADKKPGDRLGVAANVWALVAP
jgi:predicted lipoprotein with Yx(FWY)xxD motif